MCSTCLATVFGDHKAPADVLVRESAGEEREDLDLALGEAGGPLVSAREAVACGAENRFDAAGVEAPGADFGSELGSRLFGWARRAVGT